MAEKRPGGELPVRGVVAVVAGGDPVGEDLENELSALSKLGLGGVEIRADLFPDPRQALEQMKAVPPNLKTIFTVRNTLQGGKFQGEERLRIELFRSALLAGAAALDLEWGSEAGAVLAREGAPLIVSHHDFAATPSSAELDRLGERMAGAGCRAIKVVTTARTLRDALAVLRWVRDGAREPARIGFAMGEAGFPSRILALASGSPLTYASLGPPVAPGQISAREMLEIYRPGSLTAATRLLGVIGNPVAHSLSPHLHNPALAARGLDWVYLPIRLERFEELREVLGELPLDGLSVTIPFKEEALAFADQADPASRDAGAANTLLFERASRDGKRAVRAFNTDLLGVLGPLHRRGIALSGLSAAVLGNGGAARGAVRALLEAGGSPTLYYRNEARGGAASRSLGVPGRLLSDLEAGRHRLIINATPLGLRPADPSPVPGSVFTPRTIAFDMIYDPPLTRFLEDARAAGAALIPGREMLVSQAVEQFRIFTGQTVSQEELAENFRRGLELRRAHPAAGAAAPG